MSASAQTGACLESVGAEGDTPVRVTCGCGCRHLSRAGHVESCPNQRGPSRKAEDCRRPIVYQYREGKVGSTPGGSEIEPETVRLQAVGAPLWCDGVPFA